MRVQAGSTAFPQFRAFDAAKGHRRLRSWTPGKQTINSLLRSHGETLLKRCRDAVANNPYASAAADAWETQVVGTGIVPAPKIDSLTEKRRVQDAWLSWTDEADAEGISDFYGLQSSIARALFDGGEMFARFRMRSAADGLSVPMQVQLLEAEMLPHSKNEMAGNGNEIRMGIEFDRQGRRVAYHFLRHHPGEDQSPRFDPRLYTRVPANEVAHIFKPLRRGQIRGVPLVVPSLIRLRILDDYDDAELERKRIAALFAAFITKPGSDVLDTDEEDVDDTPLASLEPGTAQQLLPGEDIKFSEPADVGGSYEAFQYRNLLAICQGMGMPYWMVTGDLRQANYSSLRGGLVDFRRKVEAVQHNVLVFQFCRRVWDLWTRQAALAGAIASPPGGRIPARWMPPAWPWVDPLKDLQAEELALQLGVKSRSQVIESQGYDPETIDDLRAQDQERQKARELEPRAQPAQPPQEPPRNANGRDLEDMEAEGAA